MSGLIFLVLFCPGSKQGIRAAEQEISAKTTSSSSGSVSPELGERSSRLQGLGSALNPAPEWEHPMGQHDRDSCCSTLQLMDPCHIPDKPLEQELTLPGCCQHRNHLSSSDSSAIRLLGTLPKCEGDLMLSVPDQSAVTALCWCRGPQHFQIIFRSPSNPRILIRPDISYLGS